MQDIMCWTMFRKFLDLEMLKTLVLCTFANENIVKLMFLHFWIFVDETQFLKKLHKLNLLNFDDETFPNFEVSATLRFLEALLVLLGGGEAPV